MIKVLIDTNVVLDALASREPFRVEAENIFLLAAEEKFQGFITANSVTDIYYLIRRTVSDVTAREALRNLFQLFSIIAVSGTDCEMALETPISDYEDALAATCAAKAGMDFIVTRDEVFWSAETDVAIVAPKMILEKF